jgi:hypothetical protein
MSLAIHSPLSPTLPDAIMQVEESGQNLSVSCFNRGHLPLAFADQKNRQIQDSGSGLFANAENILITDGTFVVVSFLVGCINNK